MRALIGYGAMLLESFVGVMANGRGVRDDARRLLRDQPAPLHRWSDPGRRGGFDFQWAIRFLAQTMTVWPMPWAEQTLLNRAGRCAFACRRHAQIFSSTIGRRAAAEHLVSLRDSCLRRCLSHGA